MFRLSRSRLGKGTRGSTGWPCLAAAVLVTSSVPAAAAQVSRSSAESAFRVDNETPISAQAAGQPKKARYKGPGHGGGGAGPRPSGTYATNDACYDAAGKERSFFNVFANDALHRNSEISWTTSHGDADLAYVDDKTWGFTYYPNPSYQQDTISYQIVAPYDYAGEHSEATVTIELGTQHEEGCF